MAITASVTCTFSNRSRCGSNGSVTPIFPMGDPIEDTLMPYASSTALVSSSIAASKSATLTPQAPAKLETADAQPLQGPTLHVEVVVDLVGEC